MEIDFKSEIMITRSKISEVAGYAPDKIITSVEVEKIINSSGNFLPSGIIEQKFGVKERRFASLEEQASDLAVKAALNLFKKTDPSNIDCLIFASGSSDLIEPATANIIQSKLKLKCPAFDVKNACNSFATGLQIADSFIKSGLYKKILLVSGEKLSSIIKLQPEDKKDLSKRLACLSMGDAGGAALIEPANDESGLYAQEFATYGDHWHLCTVPGGGSMHPHDGSKVFFEGKTKELRDIFMQKKGRIAENCLQKAGWKIEDIKLFFMHHVSTNTFSLVANSLGTNPNKFYNVIEDYGNMAAVSIPFAMNSAQEKNDLKKGDKVMLIGLASGISISVQLLIW